MDRSSQLDFTNIFVSVAGFGWKFEFGFLFFSVDQVKCVCNNSFDNIYAWYTLVYIYDLK